MYKMVLLPDADGYNSADGTEWLATQLDGGVGRYRKDKVRASKSVGVKWTMDPGQYQYWRAFYAMVGSGPFLCDLVSEDGSGPAEHLCHIVPGSVTLPTQQGWTYVQQCQLEVKPLARNAVNDTAVIAVFEASGGYPDQWYNALERLANVTIPNAAGFDA